MLEKSVFALTAGVTYAFISLSSYPRINWKEDLLLLGLISLYASSRILKRTNSNIWNNFLIFSLIFLLSQFYINDFHPESFRWWFASIPGWLTVLVTFIGVISLVCQRRWIKNKGTDGRAVQAINETLHVLVNKAAPGIIVVSAAMFLLFILNIEEISPQGKLVPDYSFYIMIAFGFVLFYSLNFSLRYGSLKNMAIFLGPATVGAMIFLVGIGAIKIYRVYTAYSNALHLKEIMTKKGSRSEEKLWHDVLLFNRTPRIKSIDTKAMIELGKISIEQGNFIHALRYYKKILADRAFDFEANLGLAEIAYKQKDWSQAYEMYKKLLYLRPQQRQVYPYYIHSCIKAEKIDKALEFISNLKKTYPILLHESQDYLIIGNGFLKKKKLSEAISYLKKGTESSSQNQEAFLTLGRAYLESGEYADGCEALERALELNPDVAEGYYYLGIGYARIRQDQKAITAFEKLVSLDNKDMRGFYHLKRLYKKMGLEEKALEMSDLMENTATKVIESADWKVSSGRYVYRNGRMYGNGTVSALVFLKEGYAKFILQARGTPAKGIWPHMVMKLDDEITGEVDVTSEELKDYEFEKTCKLGKYQLNISFTNNREVWDRNGKLIEDRNLFVRKCRIVYEE